MITFSDLPALYTDHAEAMRALSEAGVVPYGRRLAPLEAKVVLLLSAAHNANIASQYSNREGGISHSRRGELTYDDIYDRMRSVDGHKASSGSIQRRVRELASGNYRSTRREQPVINARELTDHARNVVNVFSVKLPEGHGQLDLF